MTTMDRDCFDLISNEVVASIFGSLDLQSLYHVTSASTRLHAFQQLSNDQWRRLYADRWLLDDRELAIYPGLNWQKIYQDRFISEKDLVLRSAEAAAKWQAELDVKIQNGTDTFDDWLDLPEDEEAGFTLSADPFAALLNNMHSGGSFYSDLSSIILFLHGASLKPVQEMILSGRFEILVTVFASRRDDNLLEYFLPIFERFYQASAGYKEQRKRPFGLIGLLANKLDPTLSQGALLAVANALWEVASAEEITEEMFVALDIIPKLANVIMKTKCDETKEACFSILTFFTTTTPESDKATTNVPFLKKLIEMLFEENSTFLSMIPCAFRMFYKSDISFVERNRVASRLVWLVRKSVNDPKLVSLLLNACIDLCIDSDDCCTELAQIPTLGFLTSLINEQTDEANQKVATKAALLLDVITRVDVCTCSLLELNAVDRLLPYLENPDNKHLFKHIYNILYSLCRYVYTNDVNGEIFAKLLQRRDLLLDCGDLSATEEVQEACSNFWRYFMRAVPPPRDVSVKLVNRALPIALNDVAASVDLKKEYSFLLADTAEADPAAFQSTHLQKLFNAMAERLVNFNATKEHTELSNLEKDRYSPNQVTTEISAASTSVDTEVDQGNDVATDRTTSDPNDAPKLTECPLSLDVLVGLVQFDECKKLAVQNEKLMNKLFTLYDDKSLEVKARFYIAVLFSRLVGMNAWDSARALECIEHFANTHRYYVEMTVAFSRTATFAHLFHKDNPTPLVLLGSWIVAHMTIEGADRKVLRKELDPELLKWLETYPHERVAYHTVLVNRLMNRKRKREDCTEVLGDVAAPAPKRLTK